MSKITDYAFLFQKSFGTSGVNAIGSFQLSQLNSSSVQAQLKAAGINTNSKQYKSAVKQMMDFASGQGFECVEVACWPEEKAERRYEAYRNRFVVSNSDKDWEELVSIGYAEKREFEIEKQIGYYVSELGMKYLGVLFGCIIIESK